MTTPTIAITDIRARSRHPKVCQTVGAYWSDDIVETLRNATTAVLQPYTDLWDDTMANSTEAWYAAFYLLFDYIAFQTESGGALSMEVMGSHTMGFRKEDMPLVVRAMINCYVSADGFGTGYLNRNGDL